jgi:hypothetical protein
VEERLNGEDGLGAIYPAMAYALMMYTMPQRERYGPRIQSRTRSGGVQKISSKRTRRGLRDVDAVLRRTEPLFPKVVRERAIAKAVDFVEERLKSRPSACRWPARS